MIAALKDFYVTITIFLLRLKQIYRKSRYIANNFGDSEWRFYERGFHYGLFTCEVRKVFAKFAVKLFWKAKNVIFQRFQFLFTHTFGDGEIGFHDFVLTWVNDRFTFFLKK